MKRSLKKHCRHLARKLSNLVPNRTRTKIYIMQVKRHLPCQTIVVQ